ncbi:hypothetical protein TSAR_016260 [Trichomalopsis sarcophagae]|uniref:Uncharacterized protein n=1 Tax=Trichomalopsis sarcophagae TaxID=543379 RepID=A0A232EIS1_9HYME|nr:hypothetical protein TSAR_016260 [Trichomalopsis sarcophagae]
MPLKEHISSRPDTVINDYVHYLDYKETKETRKLTNVRYFGAYYAPTKLRFIRELQLSDEALSYRKITKGGCLYTSREHTICNFINVENVFEDCLSIKRIDEISEYVTAMETNTIEAVCVYVKNNDNNIASHASIATAEALAIQLTLEYIKDKVNRREHTICNFINVENVFEDCLSIKRIDEISEYVTAMETNTIEASVADMGHCGAIMVTVLKMEMAN